MENITDFATYEDFLDSQVQPIDLYYLEDEELARQLVELGFRGSGEVLKRDDFIAKKREVELQRSQQRNKDKLILVHQEFRQLSKFMDAIAEREEPNRTGKMMTIIFLRDRNKDGQEVSGFIDLADRLERDDFRKYFGDQKRLLPKPSDLSYYNWDTQTANSSSSRNYQVLSETGTSLSFKNRRDRKIIYADPSRKEVGDNTTRTMFECPEYEQVVFYDHVTRITA